MISKLGAGISVTNAFVQQTELNKTAEQPSTQTSSPPPSQPAPASTFSGGASLMGATSA